MKVMPYRHASSLCLCVHLVGLNPGCARTCDTLSYSLRVNLQLPSTHANISLWKCFIFKTPSFWSSWSHYDNEYFAKKIWCWKIQSNLFCGFVSFHLHLWSAAFGVCVLMTNTDVVHHCLWCLQVWIWQCAWKCHIFSRQMLQMRHFPKWNKPSCCLLKCTMVCFNLMCSIIFCKK